MLKLLILFQCPVVCLRLLRILVAILFLAHTGSRILFNINVSVFIVSACKSPVSLKKWTRGLIESLSKSALLSRSLSKSPSSETTAPSDSRKSPLMPTGKVKLFQGFSKRRLSAKLVPPPCVCLPRTASTLELMTGEGTSTAISNSGSKSSSSPSPSLQKEIGSANLSLDKSNSESGTSKMSSIDRFPSFSGTIEIIFCFKRGCLVNFSHELFNISAPQMSRSVSILGLRSLETMWNSRKTSLVNGKRTQGADDSKTSESEAYTQLLLSTLGRDREYATNMFRRLQRRDFAYTTPEALLEELNGVSETEEEKTKKKSHSLKRGSVFKVPHLPHPSKNLITGGSAVVNAASGLIKMGETMMKSFQKQKDDSVKIVKKNSAATLSIRRGKKNLSGLMERHSIAGIENLGSRMTIGSSISNTPVETLNSRGGWISRQPSYLSDCVSSSSNTGPAGESTPSSL
ncbi:unnamed protein product, partial [Rodentolepis nana]|uniref:RGS domain-containing protein n=1 Tax=Rodentolepis nana TaxID=102285 RepID=A0A0R3TEA8_RODNA